MVGVIEVWRFHRTAKMAENCHERHSWPDVPPRFSRSWGVKSTMTQEEFSRLFTDEVVKISYRTKKLPFNRDPVLYSQDVVPSYWREYLSHGGTPENYAQEDARLWE